MANIILDRVSISFPILHTGHRSFKKALVATATGGVILRSARSAPTVRALEDISLNIAPGDRLGLIGANGAGKSTLLRVMAGIYEPDTGSVAVSGMIMPLLELGLGFDGDLTGWENIRLRGMYLGIKPTYFERFAPDIAAFSELGEYLDLPVRTYSSGMMMRLSLGIATALSPDILLMDEWMMAGDAAFMQKAHDRLAGFVEKTNILVLASHSEPIIREWCNKALLLNAGHVMAFGPVDEVLGVYKELFEGTE
ncbi:MAG: ABC transporter ATP-binding protein [Alphaproteobacteria bacterium]|nr:ABC transporter ATP-binding protein [Alphaproteobacteria bacterium]